MKGTVASLEILSPRNPLSSPTPPTFRKCNNNIFSPRPSESTSDGRGHRQHFLCRSIMTDPTLSFPVALVGQKTTTSLWSRLLRRRDQTPPQKPQGHGFDPEKSAKPTPTHTSATAGPLSWLPATNHNPPQAAARTNTHTHRPTTTRRP